MLRRITGDYMIDKTIVCLDDLMREDFSPAKDFFYDLIREPIKQGCQANIGTSARLGHANLKQGFCLRRFKELWTEGDLEPVLNHYRKKIPQAAEDYLVSHIPEQCLVISYELSHWLEELLKRLRIPYLDIRCSPIRFTRDLQVAMRSSLKAYNDRLFSYEVSEEEMRLEAALVAASVKHLERYKEESLLAPKPLIFIGQTQEDISKIDSEGNLVQFKDYEEQIKTLAQDRHVYYKPHPSAQSFIEEEHLSLEKILSKKIPYCPLDIYTLLSSDEEIELVAISSGCIQEAKYFDKKALALLGSICEVHNSESDEEGKAYFQVRFEDFISPAFWHQLLSPQSPPPNLARLPNIQANHLRELHNVWWGYSTYQIQDKHFWCEAFDRAGGDKLNTRADYLEDKMSQLLFQIEQLKLEIFRLQSV